MGMKSVSWLCWNAFGSQTHGTWGGSECLEALAHCLERVIEVYQMDGGLLTFVGDQARGRPHRVLHRGEHYDSVLPSSSNYLVLSVLYYTCCYFPFCLCRVTEVSPPITLANRNLLGPVLLQHQVNYCDKSHGIGFMLITTFFLFLISA